MYINYFIKKSKGFFALQAGGIASYGLDGLVITNVLGPANFAIYAIAIKLFQFVSLPLAIINSPLWHVYAENFSKNKISEIKKIRNKSILGTFIFSVIFGCLIINYADLFRYILGASEINVSFLTLILFYIYTIIESTTNSYTMYLNGCSIIKIQVIATIIYLILSIFFKVILIQFHFFKLELIDVNYFIFVTLLSYLISTPLFFILSRKLYYRD
jgi:O-antigen/teichoic acid export membrane protein